MASQPRRHAGLAASSARRQGALETNIARSPLFAQQPVQLELPLDGPSLLSAVWASGRLKLSPDLDVLAWLSERLRGSGEEDGWVRFTLYELGQAVYGCKPTGRHRQLLRASIRRLLMLLVDITGYDARKGTPDTRLAVVPRHVVHPGLLGG